MAKGNQKGGSFERRIATQLSEWWTNGERDDIFWRTAGSGGRATARGRSKKFTRGQAGDIGATDPSGYPLIALVAIELKRGYNKENIFNSADKPATGKRTLFEDWVEQARSSRIKSKSKYWMIIHQRDRRETYIYMPKALQHKFRLHCLDFRVGKIVNAVHFNLSYRINKHRRFTGEIFGCRLATFLSMITPENVKYTVKSI